AISLSLSLCGSAINSLAPRRRWSSLPCDNRTPRDRCLSAHPRLEADDAALSRHQPSRDLPAQNQGTGLVQLSRQHGGTIGLLTARYILQTRRQAVGDGHVGDRFAAVVAVFQQERHHVADLRRLPVGALDQYERLIWRTGRLMAAHGQVARLRL